MKWIAGLLAVAGVTIGAEASEQPQAAAQAAAQAPASHQHGRARLRIAVGDDLLRLWLRTPLDSLVGFETSPRNARQRQALGDLVALLHRPHSLFAIPPAAECLPSAVALTADGIDPALLSAPLITPAAAPAGRGADARPGTAGGAFKRQPEAGSAARSHSDLDAAISFTCGKPQSLSGLQVRLFEVFPALEQIEVDIATPRGDSGARLSPNRNSLTW